MIRAHSLGSPLNGLPVRKGYVWRGDPALSEKALGTTKPELYRARDIPRSCSCSQWQWLRGSKRWDLTQQQPDCPWHSMRRAA